MAGRQSSKKTNEMKMKKMLVVTMAVVVVITSCAQCACAQALGVRSLAAEAFERETQAAGGQTSGRWLVLFEADGAASEGRLDALEGIMKSERNTDEVAINAAYVEPSDSGAFSSLMSRFGVQTHRYILFHSGLMFECPPAAEVGSDEMMLWVLDTLRADSVELTRIGKEVPKEETAFDRVTTMVAEYVSRLWKGSIWRPSKKPDEL